MFRFEQRWARLTLYQKRSINKPQRSVLPVSAAQNARFNFLFLNRSATSAMNFDSVEAQRNSSIAERHFRTKLKRNLTFGVEIHNTMLIPYFLQF